MRIKLEDLNIKQASTRDLANILTILNETTLNLNQKGIMQWDYPWCEAEVLADIELNRAYLLSTNDDDAIATFFIKGKVSLSTLTLEPDSMYLNQIAILPEYQGQNIGSYIIDYVKHLARIKGKPLYLDCWAGNEKLIEFYSSNGFKNLGNYPEGDYFVTILKHDEDSAESKN